MKKIGFTLAEILITLGVVGIIASLTMPALQTSVQKQSIGPALAKAINTLENANKMLLTQQNARNLTEVCVDIKNGEDVLEANSNYFNCLAFHNVIRATRENPFTNDNLRDFNLNDPGANNAANSLPKTDTGTKYTSDDGITYYTWNDSWSNVNAPTPYHNVSYTVYVDVNGPKQPNAIGRDLFPLTINAKGSVLAYGSRAWAHFTGQETWEEYCNATAVRTKESGNGDVGDFCAGSIVDNGYRVIYPY